MRLQVFLSKAGVCSRRAAVGFIRSGKVSVNSKKIIEPSFKVDPEKDKVFLNGKRISPREKIYIMLNKPKGVTTTKKDRFAKKTVMDLLPRRFKHLNPVGRLDKDTTGLILLTNDGDMINRFTHPKFNIDKTYEVKLDKELVSSDKRMMEKGVIIDGSFTAECRIKMRSKNEVEMTLHEGRKRQIRRMFSSVGYKVRGLKRTREGLLNLAALPEGRWRLLTRDEIKSHLGLDNPERECKLLN
ncbi:MAG: rRNA pseudouridine synthase [Candidatus Omnitrophica bacterium]|nr:rRNA pseudouridine synthase [Candidatus Omnitrophota bacterium]MBU4590174.1 rRNA pseudouridine synthase [Candidatus Omnitrophota bacterium]